MHERKQSMQPACQLWANLPCPLCTVSGYEGVRQEQLSLRCLRKKHYMSDEVLGAAIGWFNALCVDDADLPAFREWQRWQRELEQAEAEAQAAGEAAGAAASGMGDVAAQAAAAAAAQQQQAGDVQQPEDFWALQAQFYKTTGDEVSRGSGAEQQAEEVPSAVAR